MQFIVRSRGGGKTTEAINWFAAHYAEGAVIVSHNHQAADDLAMQIGHAVRGITIGQARARMYVYDTAPDALRGHTGPVLVENVDIFLARMFGNVRVATATDDVLEDF